MFLNLRVPFLILCPDLRSGGAVRAGTAVGRLLPTLRLLSRLRLERGVKAKSDTSIAMYETTTHNNNNGGINRKMTYREATGFTPDMRGRDARESPNVQHHESRNYRITILATPGDLSTRVS